MSEGVIAAMAMSAAQGDIIKELRAEIARLRQEADDAKADALRLHGEKMRYWEALLEMRARDDRNGSLHENYRAIIDRALDEQLTEATDGAA